MELDTLQRIQLGGHTLSKYREFFYERNPLNNKLML